MPTLKNRSLPQSLKQLPSRLAQSVPFSGRNVSRTLISRSSVGLLLALATLGLTACKVLYKIPANTFGGRPVPPSQLLERVLVGVSSNGSSGYLAILDGLRDLRGNIQDTKSSFTISGYASGYPSRIFNFPEQSRGYVYSTNDGSLTIVNYGTEAAVGPAATFNGSSSAVAISPDFARIFSAQEGLGILQLVDLSSGTGISYSLNVPNVFQVLINQGDTVAIAMTRNSNSLYRVFKLNANQYATAQAAMSATGSIDCQPLLVPIYCVVPVPGSFDRPSNAYFSLDGTSVYVLNSGPELGGNTASVSVIPQAALVNTNIPTAPPTVSPVTATIPVPGGVTDAISDGTTLYLAGQSQFVVGANGQSTGTPNPLGLFGGYLSTVNLATNAVTAAYSISDGSHNQMIFADNNTLWVGSQQCANGVRQNLAAGGSTAQAANFNCLSRFTIGSTLAGGSNAILPGWTANTAYAVGQQITDGTNIQVVQTAGTSGSTVPSWNTAVDAATTDSGATWVNIGAVGPVQIEPAITPNSSQLTVPYLNTNQDTFYYGNLTGICWVQGYGKVYTAYGGQIHAFTTADGGEINNTNITVQGTALSVAYMDALTNAAN